MKREPRHRAVEQAIQAREGHVQQAAVAAFLRTLSDAQLAELDKELSRLIRQGAGDDLIQVTVNAILQRWEREARW